ncbi:MAG TPA: ester cyclase [Flavilitoribacter sp.]|nr:ester cyclase [Flavilitoribacter sp.]HMQ88441.1 ester cyclase [Flavilitoribacter sp.]
MKSLFILSALFVAASFSTLRAQEQDAGKIVTNYFAWIDAGKIDAVGDLLTDDFTVSAPFSPVPIDKMGWKGVGEGFKSGFSDMHHKIVDWFAAGNKVAVRGVFTGTNIGSMMGNPATNNKAEVPLTAIFELDGKGKIRSLDLKFDMKSFEAQLMAASGAGNANN